MNLEHYVGQTFQEKEFYELLLFEIELNFEQFSDQFVHFYFERIQDKKIKITDLAYFKNSIDMNNQARKIIEKVEWFGISQNVNHYDLLLCRFDRTGTIAGIWKDSLITHDWCHGWADEHPAPRPMSPEEIRLAFQELAGFFEDQQEIQKLRSKKAV